MSEGSLPNEDQCLGRCTGSRQSLRFASRSAFFGWVLAALMACTMTVPASASFHCPADLDQNGEVGVSDLLIMLASWGPCEDCANCPADLGATGEVSVADLLDLLSQWGPCPEPPSCSVSTVGVECDQGGMGATEYRFTIQNNTADVLEHSYVFLPEGLIATPSYINLSSIEPGATSDPITITIARGGPCEHVCLTLTFHDAFLDECCAQEICLTLPDCDGE